MSEMHVQREWYTAQEVATIFGVSKYTVYDWCAARIFPSAKIGGTLRIDREAFDAYHEALKATARGGARCLENDAREVSTSEKTSDLSRHSSLQIVPRDPSTAPPKRRRSAVVRKPSKTSRLSGWASEANKR